MKLNDENLVEITAEEINNILQGCTDSDDVEERVQLFIERPAYEMAGLDAATDSIYDVFEDVDLLRDTVASFVYSMEN